MKILIIGHVLHATTCRWLRVLAKSHRVLFISLSPYGKLPDDIKNIEAIYPMVDNVLNRFYFHEIIAKQMKKFKPEIVHSIGLAHAGFLAGESFQLQTEKEKSKMRLIASSDGEDISSLAKLVDRKLKIKMSLGTIDELMAESLEEEKFFRELGFKKTIHLMPRPVHLKTIEKKIRIDCKDRSWIMINGSHSQYDRPWNIGFALEKNTKALENFKIGVFEASRDVEISFKMLADKTGLDIRFLEKVSHIEHLKRLCNARSLIHVSIKHGVSNSLLDALETGAYPLVSENFSHLEVQAIAVDPGDPHAISSALKKILNKDLQNSVSLNYDYFDQFKIFNYPDV